MILVNLNGGVVTFELVGIYQYGFVSQILRALQKCLRIFVFDVVLKLLVVPGTDAVPEFGCSVVHIVDARQVEIFSMPAKHCPESSDVEIRSGDAEQINFS